MWELHRDWLDEPARQELRALLQHGAQGCLRHLVPASYTNIAILNAGNLIVAGQQLGEQELVEEGKQRLDAVVVWTWRFGTHEYVSSTYHGVSIAGLSLIAQLAQSDRARSSATQLLGLFWTDVAANWHVGCGRMTGPHSRSYDYLRGTSDFDALYFRFGYLDAPPRSSRHFVFCAMVDAAHGPVLGLTAPRTFPRLVRQCFGPLPQQSRTNLQLPQVSLGTAGAGFGPTDLPVTVDFAGRSLRTRGYFIPDGRDDPYGKKTISVGVANHPREFHLTPFWAAAQSHRDALAIVHYRQPLPRSQTHSALKSQFVLPRDADEVWIGNARVPLDRLGTTGGIEVAVGEAVVVRYGEAAFALRWLAACQTKGDAAPIRLVDDGNHYGAVRVYVDHFANHVHPPRGPSRAKAAIWVRVTGQAGSEEAFAAWRSEFLGEDQFGSKLTSRTALAFARSDDGAVLSVDVAGPFDERAQVQLTPAPYRRVLEIDGMEVGQPLLAQTPAVNRYQRRLAALPSIALHASSGAFFEAEDAYMQPGMEVVEAGAEVKAAGGRYLWQSPETPLGGTTASATWKLRLTRSGKVYLWARTMATEAKSDSFHIRISDISGRVVRQGVWHVLRSDRWRWQPIRIGGTNAPAAVELDRGEHLLELLPREPGSKIDRCWVTYDPRVVPR